MLITQKNFSFNFQVGIMEDPRHLVSSTTKGISEFTEADSKKMAYDLFQVTKDPIEQIALPVELHFDGCDVEHGIQAKCSLVSVPSEDDISCENAEHLLEELIPPEHEELSGFVKEYSSLTEDALNIGDKSLNQGREAACSESWFHQHGMKLDDLYNDELQKINENVECPFGINEAEGEDLALHENRNELEEVLVSD